jgi:hypothetical protein
LKFSIQKAAFSISSPRRTVQKPKQIAGRDIGDHRQQHEEDRDPEYPAVVHLPPSRPAMMMRVLVFVFGQTMIHSNGRLPARFVAEKQNSRCWPGLREDQLAMR